MNEKASILIVDDNVSLGKTMSFILKRKGYSVVIARDGQEAIERVKETPFDIIFMDIKMPLMNGVETYRRVKKIRTEAVVIMMTAYAVEDLVQEALCEGAYGIIYKPLDNDRVISIIEEARHDRRGALILVVDDDPGTCAILRNVLRRHGYGVHLASTGEVAIAEAREAIYDIIFIDVKLPTINGLETYTAIHEIRPEAVVIMMTGYRQEVADLVKEALNNNAYTCLYKPLDMEKLITLVDEIWRRKRGAE